MATTHQPTGGHGAPRAEITGSVFDATVAVTTSATTTDIILKQGFAMGSYDVPAGSSITSITWYGSNTGTPLAASDEDVVAVTQTVAASKHVALPSALAASKYIYPVGDAAGTIYLHMER